MNLLLQKNINKFLIVAILINLTVTSSKANSADHHFLVGCATGIVSTTIAIAIGYLIWQTVTPPETIQETAIRLDSELKKIEVKYGSLIKLAENAQMPFQSYQELVGIVAPIMSQAEHLRHLIIECLEQLAKVGLDLDHQINSLPEKSTPNFKVNTQLQHTKQTLLKLIDRLDLAQQFLENVTYIALFEKVRKVCQPLIDIINQNALSQQSFYQIVDAVILLDQGQGLYTPFENATESLHALQNSVHNLPQYHKHVHSAIAKQLEVIEQAIGIVANQADYTYHFLTSNALFIKTTYQIKQLERTFANAISTYQQMGLGAIDTIVRTMYGQTVYPYISMANTLIQEIKNLEQNIGNLVIPYAQVKNEYDALYHYGYKLLNNLNQLKDAILLHPQHSQEINNQLAQQMENNRINALNAQAAAEERKAIALQEKARVEELTARALLEKARSEELTAKAQIEKARSQQDQARAQEMIAKTEQDKIASQDLNLWLMQEKIRKEQLYTLNQINNRINKHTSSKQ